MAQVLNHVNAQVSIQPKCDLCDHVNDGIYCCYECGKVLCRPCRTTHDNIGAATKDHNVTDLKYVDLISFKNIPNCKEHNTDFSLYCTSCNVLICQECVTTTHSGDTFSTLKERSILMKKEAEVHFVKMKDKLAKSSTIISEIENNHLPEIENQAKCVLEEIKLAMSEIHQVINSKSDLKKTVIEDFEYDEKEQLKIDLANRKHIHNRCSEVKYSFEKLVKEKHALTFLTAYKNLKGKIVDFEDIDQRPIECKRPPHFDRKVFVEDLIDGITSQFEKSDSAQIKTYHFYKDQIPRLIKENERLKLSEKQSKDILKQIDEEMKSLKDTTKILIKNTESLHHLLSDMENKLKLSEQQSKQLLEQKENELKTLEDTNEQMTKENETLHGLLDDIERQLRLSEKQSEDVLERKDKEIQRLEDTYKVMKVEKESLQDQLSDIQSKLKLSENQYKDVLEEKEIELKRLEDRHVVMKAEKKSLQDLLNDIKSQFKISETESKEKERDRLEDTQNLLEAEKQSLQDLLNKSDNKFKLSEKQFKEILEENGKELKRLQDAHIVMKAEKRSLQDLLNDIKSQLEKEKLKSKEWVKLSEIHSKEILEKKERQFKRLETEKESLQYIVNDLNSQLEKEKNKQQGRNKLAKKHEQLFALEKKDTDQNLNRIIFSFKTDQARILVALFMLFLLLRVMHLFKFFCKPSTVSKGKPRIFMFQACRRDNGDGLKNTQNKDTANGLVQFDAATPLKKLPSEADILRICATIYGNPCHRRTGSKSWNGSWLIHEFLQMAEEMHTTNHILEIMTAVANQIATGSEYNECQMVISVGTLRKLFYL